ncbi:MAG: chemotaxis protein CheW [Alphaproteobacteria bacterium]|nr:chemotaxis protein CheW [Alphaproteobacteria bacterium]
MKETSTRNFVTVTIAGQLFGIPVLCVQDVLGPQSITRIPLAPPEVAGALNLRGRIVTAIDVRRRLNLPPRTDGGRGMSVVVEHRGEPYSLLIDSVGEVIEVDEAAYERAPATLDPLWRQISSGIYRLDGELLLSLDVDRLLDFGNTTMAA